MAEGKGSLRSRAVRWTKNRFRDIKTFYKNTTRTRTQKALNVGKGYVKRFINNPALTVKNPSKPLSKRIVAGTTGVLAGIPAAAVLYPAAALGAATATVGATTRLAAPIIGTTAGATAGLAKGALEVAPRMTYGLGKALYHLPTASVRGIKYSMAKRRFQKRTGFSNRTLSNIESLESKKQKAQTELDELIKRQEQKLEGKASTLSINALEKKQKKYETQRQALEAKIKKRDAALQKEARRKLSKTRKAKAKYGNITRFKLNGTRQPSESNLSYGKRIGVRKKEGETNAEYSNRLKTFEQKEGETSSNYLRRRMSEQYELQKTAYNAAIIKRQQNKKEKLSGKLTTKKNDLVNKQTLMQAQNNIISEYTKDPSRKKDFDYFRALSSRAQIQRDISALTNNISNINKELLSVEERMERLKRTKGLNAKKERMERRRRRLEESKQNLTVAGKHIISPFRSIYYGTRTGAQIGNIIGRQALKYGTFGRVKTGVSNSGLKIRKSFDKFRNLGMSSTLKQNNDNHAIKSRELLQGNVQSKKKIKFMKPQQLNYLGQEINKRQGEITVHIKKLTEFRNKPELSISQKVRLDNIISQLQLKYNRYSSALLRVQKRLATIPEKEA